MGFLVPLYLAGLAALSLPLVLHLVRRTPRGRQDFSSLMFLAPTPPRLTRRSRLDQLLLLALRLSALTLLAIAFARPFLREAAALSLDGVPGKRVAILVDTSASMRRGDLWQQAVRRIEHELDELTRADDVALYTFSDRLSQIVGFDQEAQPLPAGKPQAVRARLAEVRPSWGGTDLGAALAAVAGEMDATTDARQSRLEPQIIVVSDFQKGARIDALQAFEWPKRVSVVFRPVVPVQRTNAAVRLVANGEGDDDPENIRVRIVNAADSSGDQFQVAMASRSDRAAVAGAGAERSPGGEARERGRNAPAAGEIAVYVPAGQSRIVRLPRTGAALTANRIVLRGDDHDFDNTFYLVPLQKQKAAILYVGGDAPTDTRGLLYYLRLAVANDPLRETEIRAVDSAAAAFEPGQPAARLAIVTQAVAPSWERPLREFVEAGGILVLVATDDAAARGLPVFFDDVEPAAAGDRQDEYRLLGDIDFAHPLFAPFSNPRYGDFTKIHFWKYRRLMLKKPGTTAIVARFDNGDPAVLERNVGRGRMLALASGWQPADSQLAVSSKFVPLIGSLLDRACGVAESPAAVAVHSVIPLPEPEGSESVVVRKPDLREVEMSADAKTFADTDEPGIYQVTSISGERRFAVNLASPESDTAPLELEQLEQRGVRVGTALSRTERMERVRQERDVELEERQQVWRWLVAGAIGVLLIETWLAGRADRRIIAARPIHQSGSEP